MFVKIWLLLVPAQTSYKMDHVGSREMVSLLAYSDDGGKLNGTKPRTKNELKILSRKTNDGEYFW